MLPGLAVETDLGIEVSSQMMMSWGLSEVLCYLRHRERTDEAAGGGRGFGSLGGRRSGPISPAGMASFASNLGEPVQIGGALEAGRSADRAG